MRSKVLFVLVLFLGLSSLCSAKDLSKALPPRFRDWLKKDVVYIITNEEKDAFLSLTADDARDRFIERFWELRNPTPGSPDNPFKIEHYRRLEYATQYFGHLSHTEGWRTDMGRIYITLGEPAQRQKLLGLQKVYGLKFKKFVPVDVALRHEVLQKGQADVSIVFTTDPHRSVMDALAKNVAECAQHTLARCRQGRGPGDPQSAPR